MSRFLALDATLLPALLHVGFSARLSPSSTLTFLAPGPSSSLALRPPPSAPLWYIISRDAPPPPGAAPAPAPRAVVVADSGAPAFLDLTAGAPRTSPDACAVRVVLPERGAQVFGFREVRGAERRLAVRGGEVVFGGGKVGGGERFALAVCAASVGRGPAFVAGPDFQREGCVGVGEALTFAMLELGVRWRVRSAFGRVLWRVVKDEKVGKKGRKVVVVRQDGQKSGPDVVSEDHIVFKAVRRGGGCGGGFVCSVLEAVDGKVLTVGSENLEKSKVLLQQSAAVLASMKEDDVAAGKDGSLLILRASGNKWGGVSIGGMKDGRMKDGEKIEWLMAGPRGMLEVRNHCSGWETFTIEIVEQSYRAEMQELPRSSMFAEADAADKSLARSLIAAKVASARSAENGARLRKPSNIDGFNHAAALGGLGGDTKPTVSSPGARPSSSNTASAASKKGGQKQKRGPNSGVPTSVAAAVGSTMPRSAMSKKAKQRAKKEKKKAMKAKAGASSASVAPQPSGGSSSSAASAPASDGAETSSSSSATESAPKEASSSDGGQSGNGPPCAACGRMCTGVYTNVGGKSFHPKCFGCRTCRRPILPGESKYREHNGGAYCGACYASGIAPRCARCTKPILESVTTAMDKNWHKACLTCIACKLPLTETFWLYADKPNEPRCNRCVTGSDERIQGVHSRQRNVNLPGPLFNRGNATGIPSGALNAPSASSTGGRARLTTPILPNPNLRR